MRKKEKKKKKRKKKRKVGEGFRYGGGLGRLPDSAAQQFQLLE